MAELKARTACGGLLPIAAGGVRLRELDAGRITSLMPRAGQMKAASAILKKTHGCGFPQPGRASGRAGCRAVWAGLDQAFLIGPAPDVALTETCAITDQSDGWAVMLLEGAKARDVLARLCPLDLRPDVFRRGHCARSLLGHMNMLLIRTGAEAYQILVLRSMAASAVHELRVAMKSLAAQVRA